MALTQLALSPGPNGMRMLPDAGGKSLCELAIASIAHPAPRLFHTPLAFIAKNSCREAMKFSLG
jgi:hypothetical protein